MEMNKIAEGSARETNVDEQTVLKTMEAEAAKELTANEDPQFGSKKLSEMTGPEMLELQHEMVATAQDLGMNGSDCLPRKVWRNKADGVRTILALHKRIAQQGGNTKAPEPISPGLKRLRASKNADAIRETVIKDGDAARATVKRERKPEQKAKAGRPRNDAENKTLKVLHKGPNPKRANAAKRYSYYRDGMTVAEYIKKVRDRGLALADIRWDTKQGWIKLV